MIEIELVRDDVIAVPGDVLLLKHAQAFHGADELVMSRLSRKNVCYPGAISPAEGEARIIDAQGAIDASHVLFVGTPSIRTFRYRDIRMFAMQAIEHLDKLYPTVETLVTTVHGAGFGLDIEESFRSMIFGFQQGLAVHPLARLRKIVVVERNPRRFEVLQSALGDIHLVVPKAPAAATTATDSAPAAAPKKIVFVAMPFSEHFDDVYQFGIYQTIRKCGFVCEKVDESVYAGSIIDRIMCGIQAAEFVIADLSEERPNVYLEVGYAWGLNKQVLLVAREGQRLHFDLSHHKCLFYNNIGKLANLLDRTVRDMYPHLGVS